MMSGGDRSEMSSFTFPAEWHDDERMNVMFAPFRDKATYLRSWEQKMKFWTKLISERCKACDELIIDSKMLPHLFMRKEKIPCGLDVVLTEMARSGRVQRLSEYETKNPTGWLSWGYNTFVKTPFVWSVNKLLLRSSNPECQQQFVLLEAVQAKGKELIQRHQSSMECSLLENIVELTTLKRKYKDMFKDDQTFNLVLKQLEKEKKIILFKVDNSATVVKFAEKHEAYVSPVRDIETKVFRIQQTSELLEKEAEILSSSVEKYTEEARMYLRKGLKSTALSVLRKKKKTQTLLDKKLSTLDIFHGLIENIKNTVSEKMVIEAYEVATSTLKGYMKTNKLSVDRVEDVMDNLHEVTQDQEEIATTIGNFQPSSWDMTQDDFEAELDSILAEDSPEKSSPPKAFTLTPTKPGRSLIAPQPVEEMDDDYSALEDRLRQLYNPNTSSTLPDVPMFEPSPVSSPGSPAKRVATREEEPMITS